MDIPIQNNTIINILWMAILCFYHEGGLCVALFIFSIIKSFAGLKSYLAGLVYIYDDVFF